MQPDPTRLLGKIGLDTPPIGFYDVPDPSPFVPLVKPRPGKRQCIFAFYNQWIKGKTLHNTIEKKRLFIKILRE